MCCLKYEQDAYEYLIKITPPKGALVKTREGKGTVVDVDLIQGNIKVLLQGKEESAPLVFSRREVKVLSRGKKEEAESSEQQDS